MTPREQDMPELDALLHAAQGARMGASPDLLARVLQDAYDSQPPIAVPVVPSPGRGRILAQLLAVFSGFGAAGAGLATAGLAGIWLGFAPPAALAAPVEAVSAVLQGHEGSDATQGSAETDLVELIPSLDGWLAEG